MADFQNAQKIDLTQQATAMIRLIQAGQSPQSDSKFSGRFGPGFPPMPVEAEVEPRLFQYQPGTNLMMIPRMGYNSLPFATLRAMAGACKEIRINIEHIKRIMRGVDWDIIPFDKKKTVVGGRTYVATPETESVKKFFLRPDGLNPFDTWLNMVLEEILVTDALTLWPVQERGSELQAIEVVDGTTIKPLLDMRGATPRPPMPAYLQIIWGTPQSSYPANTIIYRPLNTKVNTPYGESAIEWILTAINTAIRKDLSAVGYYADGNIPGAFYTVPESWTPEQIQTFQSYIDALMAGDLSRFAKLLAVPGGTGSHVTTFQNNDPDNPALNEYLMKVACWAYGNNPAEFGITGGAGLGGAGFMEGSENIQQRSLIGPVSKFLAGIFTEIIHDWMKRPDLQFSWTGLELVEDRAMQATADTANVGLGVYTVAFIQDREGIPQEYRPATAPTAYPQAGAGATLPMPLPPGYEQYLKRAIDADLKQWETKALRSLKKGWGPASFTSEVLPVGVHALIAERLAKAKTEAEVKAAFNVEVELHKHYGPGTHKTGSPQSIHGGGGGGSKSKYKLGDIIKPMGRQEFRARIVGVFDDEYILQYETVNGVIGKTETQPMDYIDNLSGTVVESIELGKRDNTERAMTEDMTEYFTGLVDRITATVKEADGAVLHLLNMGGDAEGKEESGRFFKREFKTDEERKAAFANMRSNGTYDPAIADRKKNEIKDKPEKQEYTAKGTPVSKAINNKMTGKNKAGVVTALAAIDKVHGDGNLPQIPIERSSGKRNVGVYQSYGPMAHGIKVSSGGNHPAMTTAHEMGHFIDHKGFEGSWESVNGSSMDSFMAAAKESQGIKDIASGKYDYIEREYKLGDGSTEKYKTRFIDTRYKSYLLSRREVFARAYAQYITIRSNDPIMLAELRETQKGVNGFSNQWSDKDFEPIALELDKMFKAKGWLE